MILTKGLDREEKAIYNLTVQATNQAPPYPTDTVNLLIIVLDINDNPPEFAQRIYSGKISEGSAVNASVLRVLATSRDTGVNAEITYSIIGGNEHRQFRIDGKTGTIKVASQLDYEKVREYRLTIAAVDGGKPPLSNQATVNITIQDENDNIPIFTQASYSTTIKESAQIGDRVLQVSRIMILKFLILFYLQFLP